MADIVELDELTINQIAAGEVVERPASVVKELVENSIDANAKNITIEVENGGISLIRVIDDGNGIKQDDVEIAFERHATSKIRSANDLEGVSTMGFRGEALASIAAISKIQLLTKVREENIGTKVNLEAGDVLNVQPSGASDGTTITIEDLFFNTPVRYKFLRKDYTEAGYIEDIVRKLAIINKDIAFKLVNNGKVILQTTGNGDTKSVIYSIFGEEIANAVIDTEYVTENIKVTGVVGKPEIARSNRRNQMFFVNNRYVKDATLTAAATKAFKGLIPLGRFGFCILNIQINPQLIDVNVHPTKEEIRFKDEKEAFSAVNGAITNALNKSELVENIFEPKYDENNFTHFNNYTATTGEIGKLDNKNVEEILKQPEENMIQTKKKSGFFNFKEKKSDRDIEEEELEKKHSEIYETLMKNPKFSYEKMLKEKELEEQVQKEAIEDELKTDDLPKFDWIGEEQNTEKISKIKEQIDRTSALNIHTILNRYKEQLEEDEEEQDKAIREGLREEENEEAQETEEQTETVEETKSEELKLNEEIEGLDPEKEEEKRIAEEKYKAIFDSYRPGDYLKEEPEEIEEKDETEEETKLEPQEMPEETLEEKEEITKEEPVETILENEEEPKVSDKLSSESILARVQGVIAQDSITKTPELKPLAQEDMDKEHGFSEELREDIKKQAEQLEDLKEKIKDEAIRDETTGFTLAKDSFVEKEETVEEKEPSVLDKLGQSLGFKDKEENKIEAQNIAANLIAQKVAKGEVTGVLDLDAINKILAEEIKEKEELEKTSTSSKFDFAKMYKRAFGVETLDAQQQKKELEENMNMANTFTTPEVTLFNDSAIPFYSVIGVVFGTYIIIEMNDSIYMIDQHATHERLLYEEVKLNYYNDQYKDSQTLLLPDVITLSYREMEIVRNNIDIFKKAGFELEEFGINTIKLVAVPSMIEILNTKELFLDILDEIDSAYVTGKDEIEERFLSTIACKAAVKANMSLDEKEIRALLDDLLRLHNPFTCPHGRPTAIKMTKADLERKFARR